MCMTPGPRPVFERSHKSVESAPPPETPALIIVSECSQELGRGILCSAVTCSEGSLVVRCVSLISTGVPVWSCRQAGRQTGRQSRQADRQTDRQTDMLSRRLNS
jgi:hypothetical protein